MWGDVGDMEGHSRYGGRVGHEKIWGSCQDRGRLGATGRCGGTEATWGDIDVEGHKEIWGYGGMWEDTGAQSRGYGGTWDMGGTREDMVGHKAGGGGHGGAE